MLKLITFLMVCFLGTILVNLSFWEQRQRLERREKRKLIQISFGVSLIVTSTFFFVLISIGKVVFWTNIIVGLGACLASHLITEMFLEGCNFKNTEVIEKISTKELKLTWCFTALLIGVGMVAILYMKLTGKLL